MTIRDKIKPCPFCGAKAGVDCSNSISCSECHAQMTWDDDVHQDMVDEWNARAALASPPAEADDSPELLKWATTDDCKVRGSHRVEPAEDPLLAEMADALQDAESLLSSLAPWISKGQQQDYNTRMLHYNKALATYEGRKTR